MKTSWLSLSSLCGIGLLLPSLVIGSEIKPGFDLFETPAYTVNLGPPLNSVELVGNPEPLASEGLGNTDTIVERKEEIDPFSVGDSDTIPIELVVLSLKSVDSVGLGGTKADLYVVINALGLPGLPLTTDQETHTGEKIASSKGQIKIDHDYEDGNIHPFGNQVEGTFESTLPDIQAFLIFMEAGKKLSTDKNDWLHSQKHSISLDSTGWWSHKKPAGDRHNKKYPAGRFYIVSPGTNPDTGKEEPPIKHTGPHPVIVTPVIFAEALTATMLGNSNVVQLSWITSFEKYMAGFVVYSGELNNGLVECTDDVNDYASIEMIGWKDSQVGGSTGGASYSVDDPNGQSNSCYGLVSVGFDGTYEIQTTNVSP